MRLIISILTIFFGVLFSTSTSTAAVTTYSDRMAYNSAAAGLGTPTNIDFTTRDNGDYITLPGADQYFNPLTLRGVSFEGRSYYNLTLYEFPGGTTAADLPGNTYAFGLDMYRFYGTLGTFSVTLSTGQTYTFATTPANGQFFGATSDEPIKWAKFSFNNDYFVIDNFVYGANAPIPPPPQPPLLSGVVSHWPGEGNTNDVVGPNNGTFQNGSAYAPGVVGQSFSLDGVSRYITAPDSPSLSLTDEFTLEARINLNTNNRQQAIIEKYDVPGRNGYLIRLQPDGRLLATICDPVTCDTVAVGQTVLATNTWYHVAAVYNGGSIRIYLDGVLDGLIVTNRFLTDGSANLKIGARGDDANTRLGGLIDEVKIYNRALSPVEIQSSASPAPPQSRAYVTNQGTQDVKIIDLASNTIVGAIPLGVVPNEIALTPDGTRAYVGLWNNTVAVVNTVSQSVIATVATGAFPFGVAVKPDGSKVYVTNNGSNTVSVIDTATNAVSATVTVGANPVGVAFTPDGSRAYVTNIISDTVSVIDTATDSVTATLFLGSYPPYGIILPWGINITPDGSRAVVTNVANHSVTVIDTSTNTIVTKIGIAGGFNPRYVDFSPDGNLAYVSVEGGGNVSIIDMTTLTEIASFNAGVSPFGLAISANGGRAYVANYNTAAITVVDTGTLTLAANIPMAPGGFHIALWELAPADSTPPQITYSVTGTLGGNGWYTSDVNISWSASDAESSVSASTGCEPADLTSDTTGVTFTCTATSGGGTSTESVTIKRDATAPAISCGSADGVWHSADISIACNSSDATSGLVSAGDASFSLSTSVAVGTETANASTDSRPVCDNAGNCSTAGPITGNMIDKKAPEIAIVSPISGGYIYNQSIFVNYTCTDGGSLVALCNGTTLSGGLLDTGSIGSKSFTVNSTDNVGNISSATVNYTVSYSVPTNRDECKDGGWQTLQRANGTLFNNQGDCVSYVNTGN